MSFNQCEPRKTRFRTWCCQNLPCPHSATRFFAAVELLKIFLFDASASWTEAIAPLPPAFPQGNVYLCGRTRSCWELQHFPHFSGSVSLNTVQGEDGCLGKCVKHLVNQDTDFTFYAEDTRKAIGICGNINTIKFEKGKTKATK